jgi:alpha-tubulin suppressor-like RCC1 family protein
VCELRAGARWCWGDNSASEFGDGSTTASALPELIISPILSNPTTWQNVHINQASAYVGDLTHACSIDPTNALYCWGDNLAHESNYGINGTPLSAPSKVNISGTVTSVSVGVGFTCAIANTTLGCWGRNVFNELGDGTSNDATSPVAPGLPSGYVPVSVVSGSLDSCVLDAGGHAVCWGPNFKGEAGGGSTMAASKPVAIAHTWQSISVGEVHACGIGLDHTLWCWGSDERGQLGDGKQDNTYAPQQVGTDTDWSEVACGYAHSCATKSDGRLFCWGDSSLCELGDGRGWRASLAIVPAP